MTTTQHDIDSPENLARRRHGRDVLSRIDGDRGEAVIDSLAHRVVVMQHGKIVEKGARAQVLLDPQEEYTKRLLAAAPVPNPVEQRERREERHRLLEALGDEVVEIDTRELD